MASVSNVFFPFSLLQQWRNLQNHLDSSTWNNQQSSAETVNHPVLYWQHLKYQPSYKLISLSSVNISTGIQDDWVKVRHVHDSHM
jgi:hypothetical protein